jgi:hypothetical protein
MADFSPSILDGLFSRPTLRRALVVPVLAGFRPGVSLYEDLIGLVRQPDVDVFGLTTGFGLLAEDRLLQHPEILGFSNDQDPEVQLEGVIRTRCWADSAPEDYRRIALLSYGPAMRVWSDAVGGSRAAPLVTIVPVSKNQGGFRGNALRRKLVRMMG